MLDLRRREFVALLGSVAAAWPLAARAQQPWGRPLIALLSPLSAATATRNIAGFRNGLRDLGLIEGRNIFLALRFAGGMAERMGHGGGDFWVLYHFARHILEGKPAFFDVYRAADCVIPGLLAYRSAMKNGMPFDVPDFRKKADRDRWRSDKDGQVPFDVQGGAFSATANRKVVGEFNEVMLGVLDVSTRIRAAADWKSVQGVVKDRAPLPEIMAAGQTARRGFPALAARARRIIRTAPRSPGARALRELLDLAAPSRRGLTEG